MAWIKRNIGLAIGGAVALLLMALAGWYLFSKISAEREVTTQLEETTAKYTELLNRPNHPGNDKVNNVAAAKAQHERLQVFLKQVRSQIVSPEVPKDLANRDFRALLDNTITELQREAERNGVTLPAAMTGSKDYWFTFQTQRTAVEFNNLQGLAHALMDTKALAEILYNAKVHDIVGIRRTPASKDETGADFLTDKKASTNQYAIVSPYEVTFQGFSGELAKVLDGMIKSKRCFVVRSVAVDKAPAQGSTMMPMPAMNPMMNRYGRGPAPVVQPQAPPPSRGPGVILDEAKLRVTLVLDAVRLKPEPPGAKPRMAEAAPTPAEG